MALSSLDQQRLFTRNSLVERINTDDVALEAYFLYKNPPASQLVAGDMETSKFDGGARCDAFSIPFMDERVGFRWCHLVGDGLSVGEQFLEKREAIGSSINHLEWADFRCLDCNPQAVILSRSELSDFVSWVKLSLEIADQSAHGQSSSALFYQCLSTALYSGWEFFGGAPEASTLRIKQKKTFIQRLEELSLGECFFDAFREFYAGLPYKSQFDLSVNLRQAVMNIAVFNLLASSSALALAENELPCAVVSMMNRLLQRNLLVLKSSSGDSLLLEVATFVAAIVSQGIIVIANDQSGSQLFLDQVKSQCISAFESGKVRGNLDAHRTPLSDPPMNSLIPHFKALEEMMDQMTLCSCGVPHNESLLLESQPQEWQGVVTSYNRLAERIQHAWTQQQLFMRSVSHELMTPLALISATAHRLGDRLKDVPDSDLQLMHLLENEACKADRLVRDLTDLSLCESGRLTLSLEKISAFDVLQQMFRQLELLPWGSRVQHDQLQDLEQFKDLSLLINLERLIQCLINVLENAAKYSPEASPIYLSQGTSSECFFCEIKDHGPGISIEDQANIFKPFFRGMQHNQSVPGSGVGLALVSQLVDLMNGRIAVADSSALGTVIRLEFSVVR